ncbi:hypothetical protein LC724_16315 [Blautia sp. RD014234]|nr:hypothetical protein [Blautia parvula]
MDNGSSQQVNSVRYDKFYTDVGLGTSYDPQLAMGIKYIDHDNETPDADGKWRYVYCLNFNKSSPTGQHMTYQGDGPAERSPTACTMEPCSGNSPAGIRSTGQGTGS